MKPNRPWIAVLLAAVMLAACQPDREPAGRAHQQTTQPPSPPVAEQRPHRVGAPAGDREDPWYWLRDDKRADPDVLAYLEAENEYLEAMLAHTLEKQEKLFEELRGRILEEDSTVPYHYNGYWYYKRFESGKEYPVHARRKGDPEEGSEEVLLDVNELAEGHDFFQVATWDVSPDGRMLAWLQDPVGRRQNELRIRDLVSGETHAPETGGVSSISWAGDSASLFYVENHPETLLSYRVYRYVPGEDASELMYEESDPAFYTTVSRTSSDGYNFIYLSSTVASEMRVLEAGSDGDFEVFLPRERDHEYQADHVAGRWIIRTNFEAPNFRILEAGEDTHADRELWREVVAHDPEVFIHGFAGFENYLAVSERSGGLRRIRILDRASGDSELIDFDEPAYAAFLDVNRDPSSDRLRFVYTSMTTPDSTWEIHMRTGERELLKRDQVPGDFDPEDYVSERLWVEARDGARIPVSLLRHRSTALNGSAPLYQHGYGAYGASRDPTFSTGRLSLVERGFVFAIAHVRGGQELGREWYEQGRLKNKNNTFRDFIDVTRHLVDEGLVDGGRVFAMGGSAGGLLMGAVANKAPELYAGIVAHVPFVDVVTTMLDDSIPLTANEYDEWGNPAEPEYYEYMLGYSPYDNVAARDYPTMLVTTGLWDSQVQYWEPAKWVARLRARKTDDNPLLLLTEMEAGHGGRSGRFRRLERLALEYAFVLDLAESRGESGDDPG